MTRTRRDPRRRCGRMRRRRRGLPRPACWRPASQRERRQQRSASRSVEAMRSDNWPPTSTSEHASTTFQADDRRSASKYLRGASTTTTSASPRSARPRPGQAASAPTSSAPTNWMAARLDRPRLGRRAADSSNIPNTRQPARRPAEPAWDPERRVHAAVAVRHHRHRLQHQGHRPRAQQHRRPLRPEVQGQGRRCSPRSATPSA